MTTLTPVRVATAIGAATLIFTFIVSPVGAQNDHASVMMEMAQQKRDAAEKRAEAVKMAIASHAAELKLRVADRQQMKEERLSDARLKVCQNRQTAITNHATRAATVASNIEAKFASVAAKVDAFKTSKNVTVDNYEALKADVEAKKAAVDSAVRQATTQLSEFSCTSDGPKAQLQLFVSQMDVVRQTLKDYRTSIKNLIQGVRQANGQHRQASHSASQGGN